VHTHQDQKAISLTIFNFFALENTIQTKRKEKKNLLFFFSTRSEHKEIFAVI
jgi:hypothetical protein